MHGAEPVVTFYCSGSWKQEHSGGFVVLGSGGTGWELRGSLFWSALGY